SETLLDDFMLTHPIFLPADKLQQVLLEQYPSQKKPSEGWQGWDGADRKQAVLSVAFRYLDTYRELLQEEGERSHCFPKVPQGHAGPSRPHVPSGQRDCPEAEASSRWQTSLLRLPAGHETGCVLNFVLALPLRHDTRIAAAGWRGHVKRHIFLNTSQGAHIRKRAVTSCATGNTLLAFQTQFSFSFDVPGLTALTAHTRGGVYAEREELMKLSGRGLRNCQTAGMGGASTAEEQTLMRSNLHHADLQCCAVLCRPQVEFVCYVFHGEQARWRPLNLELVLQRCSEVQHWVATEILQCQSLPKRVQLLRKFIKIAALCKQQQDLLSFLALVLGLDNPAVSRLRLTWEPAPARPSSLWAEPEKAGDPSRNHKSYRDLLSSLRPPLIPFTPLLLK
uniref:Rap guanine nucleotide exchange factor like 1 n=1 Tax=Lepisosteus oculatus TaxID=7918 RepID=W5N7S5_LEPOC